MQVTMDDEPIIDLIARRRRALGQSDLHGVVLAEAYRRGEVEADLRERVRVALDGLREKWGELGREFFELEELWAERMHLYETACFEVAYRLGTVDGGGGSDEDMPQEIRDLAGRLTSVLVESGAGTDDAVAALGTVVRAVAMQRRSEGSDG